MMRILQHHIFHLRQTDLGASFILVQFHRNILDILLCLRNDHMLQGVDTSSGLLYLSCHKLAGFFCLCKLQHIRQDICQRFYGSVQITRCKCESIRIDIIRICRSSLRLKYRNVYTHDILLSDFQIYFLLRCHQCRVQGCFIHAGFGYDEVLIS